MFDREMILWGLLASLDDTLTTLDVHMRLHEGDQGTHELKVVEAPALPYFRVESEMLFRCFKLSLYLCDCKHILFRFNALTTHRCTYE